MKNNSLFRITGSLLNAGLLLFICMAFSWRTSFPDYQKEYTEDDTSRVLNDSLLKAYQILYADTGLQPSASFGQGSVSRAMLRDYLERTDYGYVVQLPGSTLVPSPVFYRGRVYLSGGFGSKSYYSFDAKTGENIRAWDLDDDGPSSAAVDSNILVFNTESCTIFAIDLNTGEQLWSWWLGDPMMCMPTVANGMVFTSYPAGSRDGAQQAIKESYPAATAEHNNEGFRYGLSHVLVAFDLKTGAILWQRWIDGDIMSAAVASGEEIYITSFAGTLFKFRQRTGELLSVSALRATSAPVITEGGIFISKRADKEGENATEQLSRFSENDIVENMKYHTKEALYLDKDVQAGSALKSQASQMDAGNGFATGAPSSSGWQKANNIVGQSNVSSLQSFQGSRTLHYNSRNYSTMGDELICVDPETGKEQWKIKLEGDMAGTGGFMGTPPLEVGGYIIIATFSGEIMVLDPKSGKTVQKFMVGDPIRYQPVVWDGWIYVTTDNSRMHAINTGNQELTGWPMWGGNAARSNESLK